MENIEIKGLELISDLEKEELNRNIEKYKEKLKWKTKSNFSLKIAIKTHNKNPENKDKRKHYGVHVELMGESQNFEAIADGWDFNIAVKKVFNKLLEELEHRYHSSEQRS